MVIVIRHHLIMGGVGESNQMMLEDGRGESNKVPSERGWM